MKPQRDKAPWPTHAWKRTFEDGTVSVDLVDTSRRTVRRFGERLGGVVFGSYAIYAPAWRLVIFPPVSGQAEHGPVRLTGVAVRWHHLRGEWDVVADPPGRRPSFGGHVGRGVVGSHDPATGQMQWLGRVPVALAPLADALTEWLAHQPADGEYRWPAREEARANPAPSGLYERFTPSRNASCPYPGTLDSAVLVWVDTAQALSKLGLGGEYVAAPGAFLQLWTAENIAKVHLVFETGAFIRSKNVEWHPSSAKREFALRVPFDRARLGPSDEGLRELGMSRWLAFTQSPLFATYQAMLARLVELGGVDGLYESIERLGWPAARAR